MNLCNFFLLGNSSCNFIPIRDWKPLLSTALPTCLWSVSHSACAEVLISLILNVPDNRTSRFSYCHNCSVKNTSVRNLISYKIMHFFYFPSFNNVQSYFLCGYFSSASRLYLYQNLPPNTVLYPIWVPVLAHGPSLIPVWCQMPGAGVVSSVLLPGWSCGWALARRPLQQFVGLFWSSCEEIRKQFLWNRVLLGGQNL